MKRRELSDRLTRAETRSCSNRGDPAGLLRCDERRPTHRREPKDCDSEASRDSPLPTRSRPFELRRSCSSWFQHYTVSVSICTQDDVQTVCRDPTYSAVGRYEDLQHSAIQLVLRESKAHRARRDVSQEMSGTFSRFDEGLDSRVKSVRIRTNVAGSAARGRQERTDEIHVGTSTLVVHDDAKYREGLRFQTLRSPKHQLTYDDSYDAHRHQGIRRVVGDPHDFAATPTSLHDSHACCTI